MTPKFFDPDNNVNAEEFRQYLPVNVSINFDTLAPALGDAEQKHILPTIGQTNFNTLAAYYASTHTTPDTEKENLIEKLQAAVIRLAFFENFDLLSVTLTDSGLQDFNGESRAYRYQADAAKDTLGRQAYEYLQYFYDAYLASTLYSSGAPARQHTLFPTYREFFEALEMEPDFRLFNKLLNEITSAERINLPFAIGETLANELLQGTTRMQNTVVLSQARYFIAHRVLADSIMTLHAYISDDGATTRTIKAEGSNGGTNRQTADNKTRINLQRTYLQRAENGSFKLTSYLLANKSTYPEIEKVSSKTDLRPNLARQNKKTFRV